MENNNKKDEFLFKFAEALEIDIKDISFQTLLSDLNWDSLAVLSAISLADECFGSVISVEKLGECKTIEDIIEICNKD